MNSFEVTFETKCYEKDWEILLKTGRLEDMIAYNCFPFKERILYINNVADYKEVCPYAQRLVKDKVLTSYIIVDEYAKEALDFFGLNRESFKGGYYYSIAELASIYLCKTDYLLHFSSDSILEKPFEWINQAIVKMEKDPRIKVANPVWNRRYFEARQESFEEDEDFYTGLGFSDQCYLIRANDFKARIYNEKNPASERYPEYGGELFEKRVDAWMRNHRYRRITSKHVSYIHKNFT